MKMRSFKEPISDWGFSLLHFTQITFLILFTNLIVSSSTLHVDPDGGYHVKISIQSETLDSRKSQEYIDRLETDIRSLARLIYDTSNKHFFLKTASILLPNEWTHNVIEIGNSTSQSHYTSDIKISDEIRIPDVIRPTQCHLAGDEIRLPISFLEDNNDDLYKVKDKALLQLWAQYRWGVFDESGFPGNSRFPYFNRNLDVWEANACSNEDLIGSYLYPDDLTDCIRNDENVPYQECRFIPDEENNNATSSLMNNFYWLKSLDSFCTKENHDITLANRQNVFCEFLSVTEVMMSSSDWKKVNGSPSEFKDPILTFHKSSNKPLIYYLIDSRTIPIPDFPDSNVGKIRTELVKFFDLTNQEKGEFLSAFAKYPGNNSKTFEEIIPFTFLVDGQLAFEKAMRDTVSQGQNGEGYFAIALKSITESIVARKHESGAFIFVLRSAPISDFEKLPYEEELIGLLKANKIKIFAVEIKATSIDSGENLSNLVNEVGGGHLIISNPQSITNDLPKFVEDFVQETLSPSFGGTKISNTMTKEIILPDSPKIVKLVGEFSGLVRVRLTSSALGDTKVVVNEVALPGSRRNEYNENYGKGKRTTFLADYKTPKEGDSLSISYKCTSNETPNANCNAILVITSDISPENKNIDISVSTSAVENIFNYADQPNGLIIYAKLEINSQPLINLGNVKASAIICLQEDQSQCWTIGLSDNGAGIPDLIKNDGILSGVFVPRENGKYICRVSISLEKGDIMEEFSENIVQSIDQNLLPCSIAGDNQECVGLSPLNSFQSVVDSFQVIEIVGADPTREAIPARVSDFRIVSVDVNTVTVVWTSPSVFSTDGPVQVESYEIHSCSSVLEIIEDFENCKDLGTKINPTEPGKEETETLELEDEDLRNYIALRAIHKGKVSSVSNFINPWTHQEQINAPTETPITGPSSEPTTTPPTSTTESSTIQTTTESSTVGPTVTAIPSTSSPTEMTTNPSTVGPTLPTEMTTNPSTVGPTLPTETTDPSTDDPTYPSTDDPTVTESEQPLPTTTTRKPEVTFPPSTTEASEYFFKKPAAYATATAIAVVVIGGLGAAVGYLFWKRNLLIKSGKLPLLNRNKNL